MERRSREELSIGRNLSKGRDSSGQEVTVSRSGKTGTGG